MMAPVVGSGSWPAWIPRVANPWRLCFFTIGVSLSERNHASAQAAAQVIDEIDAGDESDEFAVLFDHGNVISGEDRQECVDRRGMGKRFDLRHHGRADRLAKRVSVLG